MTSQDTPYGEDQLLTAIDVSQQKKCNLVLPFRDKQNQIYVHWNSRNHRKKRLHPISTDAKHPKRRSSQLRLFAFQWQNLSWWVPFLFTLGSLVWLVNGYFSMWPLANDALQIEVSSWTAFLGGLIFIFGAYAAVLEVINRPKHIHLRLKNKNPGENTQNSNCYAHHSHDAIQYQTNPSKFNLFQVEPSNWGWWLNFFQMIGALIFYIACAAGVVFFVMNNSNLRYQWFWLPQMIGASFFVLSSVMAMLEVQDKFYLPALNKIGWHSAFYNLLGAIGFYLCAYYGAYFHRGDIIYWGSDFSTFWGSIAFLIASYLMLLEVINP